VLTRNNGEKYEGEWVYNKREGKGKQLYGNGDVFDGYFKNDKKVSFH
jgi:hypothetical protein